MSLADKLKNKFAGPSETMGFLDYLEKAKTDKKYYASAAERLLTAIGEPEMIDTAKDQRLSRLFSNRVIKRYKPFKDFYGLEEVIERIVSFVKHAAQGLEEHKQIMYLLGPPGGGKSSLVEKLKALMEQEPFYALAIHDGSKLEISPIFESPLGLLDVEDSEELGIPTQYLSTIMSPWAKKKLDELEGDMSKFSVVKLYPSRLRQIANARTEPGDENNQDISALVGKLDIRQLEHFAQDDPSAYRFNGGLCKGNRGVLEFVEMFKAPIKVLHPLLSATQDGFYNGTEALPPIPFEGMIIAHSNESEWTEFRDNKKNEAFLDRISIVKVPYNLRIDEEVEIYKKLISSSLLKDAPCAPETLRLLASFAILTRLESLPNTKASVKLHTYNGETPLANSKRYDFYKEIASSKEGFSGLSTRSAFKILSQVYNYDSNEIAANAIHLMHILETTIHAYDLDKGKTEEWLSYLNSDLKPKYALALGKEIQRAYVEGYETYGQHLFDNYIIQADYWLRDQIYRHPETGDILDRTALNNFCEKLEKGAGIQNSQDFRNEVVLYSMRYQASHKGKNPPWTSYGKLKEVIEASLTAKTNDIIPQLAYSKAATSKESEEQKKFVNRMISFGYTAKQVPLHFEWYTRYMQSK